jgi:hypothetical protein
MRDAVLYLIKSRFRKYKVTGSGQVGLQCPFHKGGMEAHPSFFISLRTGKWFCHTCQEGGRLPRLMTLLGLSPEIARIAIEIRGIDKKEDIVDELPISLLGIFDYCPMDLVNSGFSKKVLKDHSIGFDTREKYQKITFPCICLDGKLRYISGRAQEGLWPKYSVYLKNNLKELIPADTYNLDRYEPEKGSYLWRENIVEHGREVVITEGFKAALWLAQHGHNSVALAGTYLSPSQGKKLRKIGTKEIFLFLDNDHAGIPSTPKVIKTLLKIGLPRIMICRYPDGKIQPDELNETELNKAISKAYTLGEFYRRNV